eukprot:Rmarinus@m.13604
MGQKRREDLPLSKSLNVDNRGPEQVLACTTDTMTKEYETAFKMGEGLLAASLRNPVSHCTVDPSRKKNDLVRKMEAGLRIKPSHTQPVDLVSAENAAGAVNSLLPNVRRVPNSTKHSRLHKMIQDHRDTHVRAVEDYRAEAVAITEDLEKNLRYILEQFRKKMETNDEEIVEMFIGLEDEALMDLEEEGVLVAWDRIHAQSERRSQWISELERDLTHVEGLRVAYLKNALQTFTQRMRDTCIISVGELERLIEREASEVNEVIIENAKAHSELIAKLRISDVERERQHRLAWEARNFAWKRLRHDRYIELFYEHISSVEFTNPPARQQSLFELRHSQVQQQHNLEEVLHGMLSATPPTLTKQMALQHYELVLHTCDEYDTFINDFEQKLRGIEADVSARAVRLVSELGSRLRDVAAVEVDEIETIESKCSEVVQQRNEEAAALIENVFIGLRGQAAVHRDSCTHLATFVIEIGELWDNQKHAIHTSQTSHDADLSARAKRFAAEDEKREMDLSDLLQAMKEEPLEHVLQEKLTQALDLLTGIKQGYRTYHTETLEVVDGYPRRLVEEFNGYEKDICERFGISTEDPNPPPPPPSEPSTRPQSRASHAPSLARPTSHQSIRPESEDLTPQCETFVSEVGTTFYVLKDVLELITPPPPEPEPTDEDDAENPEATTAAPAANTTAKAPGTKPANPPAGKTAPAKVAKEHSKSVEDIADEGEEDAASVAPSIPPAELTVLDPEGNHCIEVIPMPSEALREVLTHLRRAAVDVMEARAVAAHQAAADAAFRQSDELTAQLETQLREHRPRAGRVELDVFQIRQGELEAHQEKCQRFVHQIVQLREKALQACSEALLAFKSEIEGFCQRTNALQDSLGALSNSKSLEKATNLVRKEADLYESTIPAKIESIENALSDQAKNLLQQIEASYETFPAQVEGLERVHAKTKAVFEEKVEQVKELSAQAMQQVQVAREAIEDALALHIEDVSFLESMSKVVGQGQSKLRILMSSSDVIAGDIDSLIEELESHLPTRQGTSQRTYSTAPSPGKQNNSKGRDNGSEGERLSQRPGSTAKLRKLEKPLSDHLLRGMQQLRHLLYNRSLYLGCLKSQLTLEDVPLRDDDDDEVRASMPPPVEKNSAGQVLTFLKVVEGLQEEVTGEMKQVAERYYSTKGDHEIVRSSKIPSSLDQQLSKNATVVSDMKTLSQSFQEASVKTYRGQVVRATATLRRLPAIIISDVTNQIRTACEKDQKSIQTQFEGNMASLEETKKHHQRRLVPGLSDPNRRGELEKLCDSESTRCHQLVETIQEYSARRKVAEETHSREFFDRLVLTTDTLLKLLDTTIMSEDLVPGEKVVVLEPMTLKQLLKERVREERHRKDGKPPIPDGKAFPMTEWPGLPIKELTLEAYERQKNATNLGGEGVTGSPEPSKEDAKEQPPAKGKAAKGKGGKDEKVAEEESTETPSVTCNDTPLHRVVVYARDRTYQQYRTLFQTKIDEYDADCAKMLEDADVWAKNWEVTIEYLRVEE